MLVMIAVNFKLNVLSSCGIGDVDDLVEELVVLNAWSLLVDNFFFNLKVVWFINDLLAAVLLDFDSHPLQHVFVGSLICELSSVFGHGVWSDVNEPWEPVNLVASL